MRIGQPRGTRAGLHGQLAELLLVAADELLEWLAAEYGVAAPDDELRAFAELSATAFVDGVRRHRPRGGGALGPREVGLLRNAHAEVAPRLTALHAKAAGLERRLAQLVIRAYALTAAVFLIFIADTLSITPDSPPHMLNRLEPLTLLSAVAGATSRGSRSTSSTTTRPGCGRT